MTTSPLPPPHLASSSDLRCPCTSPPWCRMGILPGKLRRATIRVSRATEVHRSYWSGDQLISISMSADTNLPWTTWTSAHKPGNFHDEFRFMPAQLYWKKKFQYLQTGSRYIVQDSGSWHSSALVVPLFLLLPAELRPTCRKVADIPCKTWRTALNPQLKKEEHVLSAKYFAIITKIRSMFVYS